MSEKGVGGVYGLSTVGLLCTQCAGYALCVCWKFHFLGDITLPCILHACVTLVGMLVTQCNNTTSCSVGFILVLKCTFLGSFSRERSVSQRPLPSVDRLAASADHVAHWALVFGGTSANNWLILWLVLAT